MMKLPGKKAALVAALDALAARAYARAAYTAAADEAARAYARAAYTAACAAYEGARAALDAYDTADEAARAYARAAYTAARAAYEAARDARDAYAAVATPE